MAGKKKKNRRRGAVAGKNSEKRSSGGKKKKSHVPLKVGDELVLFLGTDGDYFFQQFVLVQAIRLFHVL